MAALSKAQRDRLAQTYLTGDFASGMRYATRFLIKKYFTYERVECHSPLGFTRREVLTAEGEKLLGNHPLRLWGDYLLAHGWKCDHRQQKGDVKFIRPGWEFTVSREGTFAFGDEDFSDCIDCQLSREKHATKKFLYDQQQRDPLFQADHKYEDPGPWVACAKCSELDKDDIELIARLIKDGCLPPTDEEWELHQETKLYHVHLAEARVKYPKACGDCCGAGGTLRHGSHWEEPEWDVCEWCVGRGDCPRCGGPLGEGDNACKCTQCDYDGEKEEFCTEVLPSPPGY